MVMTIPCVPLLRTVKILVPTSLCYHPAYTLHCFYVGPMLVHVADSGPLLGQHKSQRTLLCLLGILFACLG